MQNKEQNRQQKLAMIAVWQQSGLSQKQYCLEQNIPYHVFYYWYRQSRDKADVTAPGFVQLCTSLPASGLHAELLLTDGRRILFHQPVNADFLKALLD
jgi:hypothetical protein